MTNKIYDAETAEAAAKIAERLTKYARDIYAKNPNNVSRGKEAHIGAEIAAAIRILPTRSDAEKPTATNTMNSAVATFPTKVNEIPTRNLDKIEALGAAIHQNATTKPETTLTVGKIFRARTTLQLKAVIYKHHGWQRQQGENASKRISQFYDVTIDFDRHVFTAVPKATAIMGEKSNG